MIRLKDVWYRYSDNNWVLRGIDVEIREGEVLAIVGPNGAGKTTLMKIAAGIYRPMRGRVEAWGRDLWEAPGAERLALRRRIVYVHERPILIRGTVLDNIVYGLRIRGLDREKAQRRALEAARLLGIDGLLDRPATGLSRGQQQLVAIARALAVEPKILLLDEPFAHLDREKRRLLLNVLEKLASSGTGAAIATHDTYLAARIASRAVLVENGKVETGSIDELLL
ncbi:ABC-type cobalt transport system, ATPase component [Pyrodictium delaneyi]|uniref:ABC-type cobalt transport system, ATPase component n=1 Tax=Pyrodictium delaneyi TaxID=1273541 RepID=A0A0P0N6K7_9CREN|nr:ABC transporter ATP-binding protein [Pyrodictium delaneyi]ALL01964.1 ABC-type cobalt transport system, ATPase component [Pyrodictium delaneyi]